MTAPRAETGQSQKDGSINRVCENPGLADGGKNEEIITQNNSLPTRAASLLDDPNEERKTSDLATHSAQSAVCGRADHQADVAVHGEINVGCKGREKPGLEGPIHDEECQDAAETQGKQTHGFGHFARSSCSVEHDDSRAHTEDYEQKQSGAPNRTLAGEDESDDEPYVEWDINVRLKRRMW
jgi:hypothetical protein